MNSEDCALHSLPEIASALRARELSAQELTAAYIGRIKALDVADGDGPGLQSVLSINPHVMEAAADADRKASQREPFGALHGVPVLLKDNIETCEQPTTAGAAAFKANDTGRDSDIATALRQAGAIILGKTNLTEMANFRARRIVSGWSSLGGLTLNPHVLDRSACGSSTGSAVAVAASLAAGAIGTETIGSIVCPAHMSGIVGFKPTRNSISMQNVIPLVAGQDIAGPMATSVEGAAMLFRALRADASTAPTQHRSDPTALRFGVLSGTIGRSPDIQANFTRVIRGLKSRGGHCIDVSELPIDKSSSLARYRALLPALFARSIAGYLSALPRPIGILSARDLILWNRNHPGAQLDIFGQDLLDEAATASGTGHAPAALITLMEEACENGIRKLLNTHALDFLICPTGPVAPPIDMLNGDTSPEDVGISWLAALAGCPHLTIPMGTAGAVPTGVSLIGPRDSDVRVLSIGMIIEEIAGPRPQPMYFDAVGQTPAMSTAMRSKTAP